MLLWQGHSLAGFSPSPCGSSFKEQQKRETKGQTVPAEQLHPLEPGWVSFWSSELRKATCCEMQNSSVRQSAEESVPCIPPCQELPPTPGQAQTSISGLLTSPPCWRTLGQPAPGSPISLSCAAGINATSRSHCITPALQIRLKPQSGQGPAGCGIVIIPPTPIPFQK